MILSRIIITHTRIKLTSLSISFHPLQIIQFQCKSKNTSKNGLFMHINDYKCHNFITKGLPSFLFLQITQFHHRKFVQLFLWSLKPRTNPPCYINNLPRLKQTYHYAFKSSWNQDKLPLHAFVNFQNKNRPPLCAFVNSQDQNRPHHVFVSSQDQNGPDMQIHELLKSKQTTSCELPRPKQTSIMHICELLQSNQVCIMYICELPQPNQILIICIICELPRPK